MEVLRKQTRCDTFVGRHRDIGSDQVESRRCGRSQLRRIGELRTDEVVPEENAAGKDDNKMGTGSDPESVPIL
jgi:hypothetical protein